MKRRLRTILTALALLLLVVSGVSAQGSGPAVDWWAIAGGGAPSTATGVTLNDTLGQPVVGPASGGTAGLTDGYWSACVAAAAAVPDLGAARDDGDVVLAWDADPANSQYQVWLATDAYLDPDNPGGVTPIVTADTTYTDDGAADSLENHFYVLRGLNACGAASANSERKGEFTFELTPGSA